LCGLEADPAVLGGDDGLAVENGPGREVEAGESEVAPYGGDIPWEKPAEPGRLTPARVRRGFRNLRPSLPCPARLPKSSHPGPGRPLGSKNRRAVTRYDVGKTVKRPDSITERDQVRP
jgi:hypothetical protein